MDSKYVKLTSARARSSFAVAAMSRCSLWLGEDHLLSVDSSGYTETYKRFYFQDIQAIQFYETRRGINWNIILGTIVTVIFVLVMIAKPAGSPSNWQGGEIAWMVILVILLAIFGLFLVINLIHGPTCKTYLRTAVQTEELAALSRVRRANKALAKIRPLIVAAQGGELPPDVAAAWMQNLAASGAKAAPDVPPRLS
ncbi:MAG TPA: hypothetical protein VGI03_06900 [Verrucomicrobiae bacterium]|jgi:uncharacterized integral membrane protein